MTRIGSSQAFFNIVAQFQAEKLIQDSRSKMAAVKAVVLDSFEALFKPLDDLTNQIDVAIGKVDQLGRELADTTIELQKFYSGTKSVGMLRDELMVIGEQYAIVGSEALKAGSRASQVGNIIGNDNIPMLVKQAQILTEISDLTAEESMRGIISLNQQAGIAYGNLTEEQVKNLTAAEKSVVINNNLSHSLDVLNTIANRSVAMEGDLVKAMTNFSAQAKLAGDSFEYMSAMSAVLLEAGEEHGAAGRALRMVYARLGGNIDGTTDKLEAMNITIRDSTGQMLPLQEILQGLKDKGWDRLTPAMKQNIAQTIAGNRHYVRFIKLMENFDRSVQLAQDGMLGLDSASQQADTALASNLRKLESAEAKLENIKAQMGEAMMPFQTGVAKTQADFAEATLLLTNNFGGLGEVMGRVYESFKMMEGFVKFGLMFQSMALGMEIYTSVVKQLHGIQVSISNLHSKQATFLGYQQVMTEGQKSIAQYLLYLQQAKNASLEKERFIKNEIAFLESKSAPLVASIAMKEKETIPALQEQIVSTRTLVELQNTLLTLRHSGGGKVFEQTRARLEYEKQSGQALLQNFKEIYMGQGASATKNELYMSQMIQDMEVMGRLTDDELVGMRAKSDELREQRMILQRMKSENELSRALTVDKGGEGRKEGFSIARAMTGRATGGGAAEIAILKDMFRGEYERAISSAINDINAGRMRNQLPPLDPSVVLEQATSDVRTKTGVGQIFAAIEDGSQLGRKGVEVLEDTMKRLGGQILHNDKIFQTYELTMEDVAFVTENLERSIEELSDAEYKLQLETAKLAEEERELSMINDKLSPQYKKLEAQARETTKTIRRQAETVNLLQTNVDKYNRKQKMLFEGMRVERVQKYNATIQDADRAMNRFGMAGINAISMLGGVIGGTTGATIAMIGMTANIIPAISAIGSAGKEMLAAQTAMLKAAKQADMLGAAMFKMTIKAGAMAAIMVTIGLLMKGLSDRSKDAQRSLSRLQNGVTDVHSAFDRLNSDGVVLGDDLAAQYDLVGVTVKDLKEDNNLLNKAIESIDSKGVKGLSDEMARSVRETRVLLDLIKGVKTEVDMVGDILNEQEFYRGVRAISNYYEGAIGEMSSWNQGFQATWFGNLFTDDKDEMQDFLDSMNTGLKAGNVDMESFLQVIIDYIKQGNRLSEEQKDLFMEIYNDQTLLDMIDALDEFVMTEEMAAVATERLNKKINEGNIDIYEQAAGFKNLTDEMGRFANTREELFFGGKYGNVTGSLYKTVVQQGVGTLYHKNEVIMSNNFHGFFNEDEAASRIIAILDKELAKR